MSDQATKRIMVGILICLIIIALKPVPSFQSNYPDFPSSLDINNGEAVVQLSENRIAIVKSDINSVVCMEKYLCLNLMKLRNPLT